MKEDSLWGIDLGGTKIEGVILKSARDPQVICRKRVPTEGDQGYTHVLNQIDRLITMMKQETGLSPQHIGFGTPGTLDPYTQLLINSNSTDLNGKPFKRDLEHQLKVNVSIANDANCFALAETRMGAVQDISPNAEVVVGVIMGTGVGSGIVVNGKILSGHMSNAGEWGHNFMDESGGPCYCGKSGCVEVVISGPALQKFYKNLSGKDDSLKEIYKKYKERNDEAEATIFRLIHFFGLGMSTIINFLDPHVIVIGGGVGNIAELYTDGVEAAKKYTFNTRFDTKIVPPRLGDSAGVFGAAFLVSR